MNSETDLADLATDLDSCVRLLRAGTYDLVLLIVSHGKLRARDAIARLRREAGHVPMVVLTEPAGGDTASVGGALAGHTHRIHQPSVPEAMEMPEGGHVPWRWDEPPPVLAETMAHHHYRRIPRRVSVDAQNELLQVDDQPLSLSQAEFRIFRRLWEDRGRIVSAEELMTAIYGAGERPASRVLPVFLFKLRRKLASLGLGDLVETAIGRGFTIRAEVEAEPHHA